MKKIIVLAASAILLLTIIAGVLIFVVTKKSNAAAPIEVDSNAVGNTASNLQNGGLFCEYNGYLYFSNSYDGGSLYRMKLEDGSMERLNKNRTYSINAVGDHLYYCMLSDRSSVSGLSSIARNAGVYTSKLDGSKTECINTNAGVAMQYFGDALYYQQSDDTGTILIKQSLEKKKEKEILSQNVINPVSIHNGIMYYHSPIDNHYLYATDLSNNVASLVWDVPVWNPIYEGGYIYYISMDGKYNLCRRPVNDTTVEVLTDDFVDTFNVYGNMIYYCVSSGSSPAIKRMKVDGSELEIVRTGIYRDINITSDYVYYNQYNSIVPMYRQRTFGPIMEDEFSEAASAALKEIAGEGKK